MSEIKKIECRDGEAFTVAGIEFIKFPSADGKTPVVMKEICFESRFGKNNDLRSSEVFKRLQMEVLPKLIELFGEENLCTFKTDLTTMDGLKPYAATESKVSIPTLDFYRANAEIFDKHNRGEWWWLATPFSARPHEAPDWTLCVSPSGCINGYHCNGVLGVRPFCILKSTIFES